MIRAAIIAICLATSANAQQLCGPHGKVIASFLAEHGEERRGIGVMLGDNLIMEILVNDETGTWTMLTVKDGVACLFVAGTHFTAIPAAPKGDPA